ncbi:hypothetical protein GDO78_020521 [Eleutherodactylus coqui]|uniref:Uncharacterized protein n=1 Tax=Eleutherodactylus coqui TaxID=57060 RepID=A0A8J6C5U4_ELECQ|nr:hypothetical protein GDO78_020521 [Eleutherodactylus coqui]
MHTGGNSAAGFPHKVSARTRCHRIALVYAILCRQLQFGHMKIHAVNKSRHALFLCEPRRGRHRNVTAGTPALNCVCASVRQPAHSRAERRHRRR